MERDKMFLTRLKKEVAFKLKEKGHLSHFTILKNQRPSQTNTDGWSVQLGKIGGYNCTAEIWLDKFTANAVRKVQYCLYSEGDTSGLQTISKKASKKLGAPIKFTLKDIEQEKFFCLSKRLTKDFFGKPVLEKYSDGKGQQFYGVYEFDKTGLNKNDVERLAIRATDFFVEIIEIINVSKISDEEYPNVENRKRVATHLIRERRSHLATLRKQKDNYKCGICDFTFSTKYGPLGNNFAEAHHTIPLSSNDKIRFTKIEDLITVCSNCHRMLHKMPGKADDINKLKSLVLKLVKAPK